MRVEEGRREENSYTVLEPPPPTPHLAKSTSAHVLACEVYSDVFEPRSTVEEEGCHLRSTMEDGCHLRSTMEEGCHLRSTVEEGCHPRSTVEEGCHLRSTEVGEQGHDSGLSSASASTSASTSSSSGPEEVVGEELHSLPWYQASMPR